ncbi:MAG: hypothetical protein ABIQ57_05890 [Candidatus Kapaibacterium sp.]
MPNKLTHRVRSLVERGERITREDCRDLFEVKDLIAMAKLARVPRERRFGRDAFYFAAPISDYQSGNAGAIRCRWNDGDTLALWSERIRAFGKGEVPSVAFISAGFISRLSAAEHLSHADAIRSLAVAGPIRITGEDAELFDPAFRAAHPCDGISADEWLAIHRAAHGLGLKTTASMIYGTSDYPAEYAAHLDAIRSLQDETGGFAAFAPLAIHNHGVEEFFLAVPTAAQTLRITAISRIFLDTIPHILAVPALVTLEIANVALGYGADTLDITIATEDVHTVERGGGAGRHDLSDLAILDADSSPVSSVEKVRGRIEEARFNPVPLTLLFEPMLQAQAV